jgi:Tol biopolymer transport system component
MYSIVLSQGYVIKPFVSSEEIAKCNGNTWNYDFSPDGKRFAYFDTIGNHNGTIVLMDVDGSNRIELGFNPNWSVPLFSEDNEHLIYLANDTLFIANSNGTERRQLVEGDVVTLGHEPANYDILRGNVVFTQDGNISIVNTDGTGKTTLTTQGGFGPLITPDGTQIIYIRNEGDGVQAGWEEMSHNMTLRAINVDGTGDRELAAYDYHYYIKNMQFHPEGKRLFYTVEVRNHPVESDNGIWSVNIESGNLTRYTHSDDSFIFFSHDGRSFYYMGNVWAHHHELRNINTDGTDDRSLSRSNDYFGGASMHPEDDLIVAKVGHDMPNRRGLWIMDTDGSNELKIEGEGAAPMFTPDGKYIIFWKTELSGEYDHSLHRIEYEGLHSKSQMAKASPFVCFPLVFLFFMWVVHVKKLEKRNTVMASSESKKAHEENHGDEDSNEIIAPATFQNEKQ